MARETLVVALNPDDRAMRQASIWRDLYAAEPNCLEHTLAEVGMPTIAEIFAVPSE